MKGSSFACILIAGSLLAACHGPKNATIPSDPSKWDVIANDVKKLSDDDRSKLTSYMMRKTLGTAMAGGKPAIPPGTTIGDAIKDQTNFESDQKAQEAKDNILKAKLTAEHAAAVQNLTQAASVVLTDLTVQPKDYEANRYSDRLALLIGVENHTAKAISGIKGQLVFNDQFGTEITRINLSLDEDVGPNASRTISGYGKDINQFEAADTKLANTPLSKMHVTFDPDMIVYADGSKLAAPDETGS
jgi:hypothetical protein